MLVVNLFGGPGTGKSTTAAATFAELKYRNVNAELVTEFAKDKVWEQSIHVLGNQPYLLGKQFHRLWRLQDKVDVAITDSPLLLLLHYGREWPDEFRRMVLMLHDRFNALNFMLGREKVYNPSGRLQTEQEARDMDVLIRDILDSNFVPYENMPANRMAVSAIADKVMANL